MKYLFYTSLYYSLDISNLFYIDRENFLLYYASKRKSTFKIFKNSGFAIYASNLSQTLLLLIFFACTQWIINELRKKHVMGNFWIENSLI